METLIIRGPRTFTRIEHKEDFELFAYVGGRTVQEQHRNARLVEALPELLAALEGLLAPFAGFLDREAARALLARIKGEEAPK
jgi:hypothetical protein